MADLDDVDQLRTSVHFLLTYVHDVLMMQSRDDRGLREHTGIIFRLPLAEIGGIIQKSESSTETWIVDLLVDIEQTRRIPNGLPKGGAAAAIVALQDRFDARVNLLHRVMVIGRHYAEARSSAKPKKVRKEQPPSTSGETGAAGPKKRRKPRKRDKATEARDKWIYDQCHKLIPYDTIVLRLNKKPKTWIRIASKQGIRDAAQRYALRHKLPAIPSRQDAE